MPLFEVTTMIEYVGEVRADSREEAESMGYDWEENLNYFSIDSIKVVEIEEDEDEEE